MEAKHICQYPDCTEEVTARRKYCDHCQEVKGRERTAASNKRMAEKRRKEREENPVVCEDCGNPVGADRNKSAKTCRPCGVERAKKRKQNQSRAKVVELTESKPAKIELYRPRLAISDAELSASWLAKKHEEHREEKALALARQGLNPDILMARLMRGAVVSSYDAR